MAQTISLEDVREASARIRPLAKFTPVHTSRLFNEASGVEAYFKCENLQTGGSFKIRGAANRILSIPEADRARGVVAFSSGNHAQAVAIAAKHLGISATIVMPQDAPASKLESTRANGATVITYDRHREKREAVAAELLERSGATLVPPFDHPLIMAGQGTLALELIEQIPELDALVACVGGGGLISGCATAAKGLKHAIRVFGAEPELANDTYLSLRAGHHVEVDPSATIADGLRSPTPGKLTFPVVQRLVDDVLLVSEKEILDTMRFLLTRLKLVVEPSGVAAAAVVLHRKLPAGTRRVGITISGGNVDLPLLGTL